MPVICVTVEDPVLGENDGKLVTIEGRQTWR